MEILEIAKTVGPVGGVALTIIWVFTRSAMKHLDAERKLRKAIADDCHAVTANVQKVVNKSTEMIGECKEVIREDKMVSEKTQELLTEVKVLLIKANGGRK